MLDNCSLIGRKPGRSSGTVAQHSRITLAKDGELGEGKGEVLDCWTHLVHFDGTVARLRQDLTSLNPLNHLRILCPVVTTKSKIINIHKLRIQFLSKVQPAIRHFPTCEDLPAEHPICPHIAFRRESGEV